MDGLNKMYIKDIKTKKIHKVKTIDSDEFIERHERPMDLAVIDVWYSDGSGWNGNHSGYAFGTKNSIEVFWLDENKTNNQCEYLGLLEALKRAKTYDHIKIDSRLVEQQVKLLWKCNNDELRKLRDRASVLMVQKEITIEWVPRNRNLAGIELDYLKKLKGNIKK